MLQQLTLDFAFERSIFNIRQKISGKYLFVDKFLSFSFKIIVFRFFWQLFSGNCRKILLFLFFVDFVLTQYNKMHLSYFLLTFLWFFSLLFLFFLLMLFFSLLGLFYDCFWIIFWFSPQKLVFLLDYLSLNEIWVKCCRILHKMKHLILLLFYPLIEWFMWESPYNLIILISFTRA